MADSSRCSDPIDSMISALNEEIESAKATGDQQILLSNGSRVSRSGGQHLYAFALVDETIRLREDSPIKVIIGSNEHAGSVVSINEDSVVIGVDADLGETIAMIRIISSLTFLLVALRDRLIEASTNRKNFNFELAETLFNPEKSTAFSTGNYLPRIDSRELDPEKHEIVKNCLRRQLSFIWGPPGTGKTTTLSVLAVAFYRLGMRLLVLSNANIALDAALEKTAERLEYEADFNEGLVLRLGPIVKPELEEKFGEFVQLDEVVARLSKELNDELESCKLRASVLKTEQEEFSRMLQVHNGNKEKQNQLSIHINKRDELQRASADLADELEEASETISNLVSRYHEVNNKPKLLRIFYGNPNEISKKVKKLLEFKEQLTSEIADINLKLVHEDRFIRSLNSEIEEICRINSLLPESACLTKLSEIQTELKNINTRINELENQLEKKRVQVLSNCRLLFATSSKSCLKEKGKQLLASQTFDVVMVDEASTMIFPASYYAMLRARKVGIIAGDFRQLAPIVSNTDSDNVKEWLASDAFSIAGIPNSLREGNSPACLNVLRTQHRMPCEICDVVNEISYSDYPLRTPSDLRRDDYLGERLVLFDTSSLNPWSAYRSYTSSRYNILHAIVVANVIRKHGTGSLGVITPYRAQSELINSILRDGTRGTKTPIAATVHAYQGNEKDIIVLDLPDSIGTTPGRFIMGAESGDDGTRLLNVAVSRTRCNLIVVCNMMYLEQRGGKTVNSIIRRIRNTGTIWDIEPYRPHSANELERILREQGPKPLDITGNTLFTAPQFHAAFPNDLRQASKSILIASPFITEAATSRIIHHLKYAISQGVKVAVVTSYENVTGKSASAAESALTALSCEGIVIIKRSKMHEKVAIIDGQITWQGSLNILSHGDTSEAMLRIRGSETASKFLTFMGVDFDSESGFSGGTASRSGRRADSTMSVGAPCPKCGMGNMVLKYRRRDNHPFLSCSRYPSCKETANLVANA